MKGRHWGWVFFLMILAVAVPPAVAVDIKINGDINNRFEATNNFDSIATYTTGSKNNDFSFNGATNLGGAPPRGFLGNTDDDNKDAEFGETKARLWVTAASDDGKVNAVWAVEVGALKYGDTTRGGGLSGDGVNTETRWLYVDFQMPMVAHASRLRVGLQPISLNTWLWEETAMGARYFGSTSLLDYEAAWMRAENFLDESSNDDGYFAKATWKPGFADLKLGLFGVYYKQGNDATANAFDLTTGLQAASLEYNQTDYFVGLDGGLNAGPFFAKWDLIYQTGEVEFDDAILNGGTDDTLDRRAYFLHADVGMRFAKAWKGTFIWWYASGDDDPDDTDADNFDNIDTDVLGSVVLFEEQTTDDNSWTDAPYLLDKGFQMYRARLDWQVTEKLGTAVAANYMLLAEDALNGDKDIGYEFDFYSTYEIWKGLTWNVALGYLVAGDALDAYAGDALAANGFNGDADDIYRLTTGFRYKF